MAAEDDFFVTFKNVCIYIAIGLGSLYALILLVWLCVICLAEGTLKWCAALRECYRDCNCFNCCYVCCCCCLLEQLCKQCEDVECKSGCESSYNLCKKDCAKLDWKFFCKPSCFFSRKPRLQVNSTESGNNNQNTWGDDDDEGRAFDISRNIDLCTVSTLPYDYNNSHVSNQRVDNCNHPVTCQPTLELQQIQPRVQISPTVLVNNNPRVQISPTVFVINNTTSLASRQTYISLTDTTLNKNRTIASPSPSSSSSSSSSPSSSPSPYSPKTNRANRGGSTSGSDTYDEDEYYRRKQIKNHPGKELNIEVDTYHIRKQEGIRKPRSSSGSRSRSLVRNAGVQKKNQNVDSYKIKNIRRARSLSAGRRRSRSRNICESNDRTLDLHELTVKEAMTEVCVFLGEKLKEYKENNRSEEYRHVDVITGRGLHSKDGIPKIKPAVEEYLDNHKYQYTWKAKGGRVDIDLASHVKAQDENYDVFYC